MFTDPSTTEIYTLSLHDALPISRGSGTNDKAGSKLNLVRWVNARTIKETFAPPRDYKYPLMARSEEHTSELQSQSNLVCRLLLEKKNPAVIAPPPPSEASLALPN